MQHEVASINMPGGMCTPRLRFVQLYWRHRPHESPSLTPVDMPWTC